MEKLVNASKEELTLCPGLGPQKVASSIILFCVVPVVSISKFGL